MKLSRTGKLGLLAVGGLGLVALAGASRTAANAIVGVAQPPPVPTPIPGQQGAPEPTQGPQPHPDRPNDADAGRYRACHGASLIKGNRTDHDLPVINISGSATGVMIVDMWTNRASKGVVDLMQCTAARWRLNFEKGRLMAQIMVDPRPKCPPGAKPWNHKTPIKQAWSWTMRGPTLILHWQSLGDEFVAEDDAPWFSPEETPSVGWCVDVLWKFGE